MFQGTDRQINPTISSMTFSPPPAGRKYAYFTLTYQPAQGTLTSADVPSGAITVNSAHANVNAGLVSSTGGNGAPLTARYVFLLDRHGFTRLDNGLYSFVVNGDAVIDSLGYGSSGFVQSYTLYLPRHNRGAPIATPILPMVVEAVVFDSQSLFAESGEEDISILK